MKKIKMMRVASVLLIAVMLSTCVISGTFAKYVTSDSVADHARVAKFGVVVLGSGSLFDENYWSVGGGNKPAGETVDEGDMRLTVETSAPGTKLVAPGTQSPDGGMTISVTGKPEVDVRVSIDVAVDGDVYLKAGTYPNMTTGTVGDVFELAADYYPVEYTLARNGGPVVTGTIADIEAALKEIVNGTSNGYYDANTDLGYVIGELNLTWKWDFDAYADGYRTIGTGEKAKTFDAATVDKADTLLGDLIVNKLGAIDNRELAGVTSDKYNLETGISISITVTQVD